MDHETKSLPFELKAVSNEGSGSFEGNGGAFNNIDKGGDVIAPGAFKGALQDFLDNGFIGGTNHDWETPVGHPARAVETPYGLFIKAVFDDTPEGQAARKRMMPHAETGRATIRKLSIGYQTVKSRMVDANELKSFWSANGHMPTETDLARLKQFGQIRLLEELKLIEVSPVVSPMNEMATITGAKSEKPRERLDDKLTRIDGELAEAMSHVADKQDLRFKEGRRLSTATVTNLRTLQDRCREVVDGIDVLLAEATPTAKSATQEPVPGSAEIPKSEPAATVPDAPSASESTLPSVPEVEIDEAAILLTYATTMARLAGVA